MNDHSDKPTSRAPALVWSTHMTPPDCPDPVIEAYKKDVDRTLLRENLKLSVDERFRKFERFMNYLLELREAGRKARRVS